MLLGNWDKPSCFLEFGQHTSHQNITQNFEQLKYKTPKQMNPNIYPY